MALSTRATKAAKPLFWKILEDLWHPETNPGGYVCLGLAENSLMHDTLRAHLSESISVQNIDFTYGDGKKQIRSVLSRFLTKHLSPIVPIEPSHITVTNGCTSGIEQTSWAFGEPGDVFLLGRPYYGAFVPDVTLRMGTKLNLVDFEDVDPLSLQGVERYERQILEAEKRGQRVAGLILSNPHNPLGRCYPREVLVELMRLCQRYRVNLISDEVYALSTFPNNVDGDTGVDITPFQSVLSIDTKDVIDPALVHVLWGVSKDFGANGLRLGVIISQHNASLHDVLVPVTLYSSSSSLADQAVVKMLSDEPWVESYIETNKRSLQKAHEHVTAWARRHEVEYAPGVNAAFFLWVNLGGVYQRKHPEILTDIDEVVTNLLLQERVFIASGAGFGSERPGWFRIVFSQQTDVLEEGLRRIMVAIT